MKYQTAALFFLVLVSCQTPSIPSCPQVSEHLADQVSFPCGVVVDPSSLEFNQAYAGIVDDHFNSVTAENIMKPDALHPVEGVFDWAAADQLVDYCQRSGKRLHGHTLIWHQQLPFWMQHYQGSREDWERMFKDHITQVVSHFKGKVASWDVVNEAFNDDGSLRNTIWKEHLGPSYLEKAFRYAHEADPEAKLFYNDYSVVLAPQKRAAILAYFSQLKAQGVPIHGIGVQMHIYNGFPTDSEISQAMDDIWRAGFLVHLSELDISINPLGQAMPTPPEDELARQANRYLYIFQSFKRIPEAYQFGITIWGVSDADSWIRYFFNRDDYPLLFDDQYQPKPAFCKLISTL